MKAVIIKELVEPGGKIGNLTIENVEIPKPGKGEILIRLRAASVNRRDVFIRYGLYPKIKVPCILGADGAGIIEEIGDGVDGFKVGEEVIINPSLNWGSDPNVPSKEYEVLGMPTNGTYAQYVVVPSENVFYKPKYLSWEEAAALPLAGITAYRAVCIKGQVQKDDIVLIPGIGGGVASFILQIAVQQGANVYVTSGSEEKINKAVKLGAKAGKNYRSDNWVQELRRMIGGADVSFDSIGGETFINLITLTKQGGKIVTIGATSGLVNNLNMSKIFLKQLTIMGSMMGSPNEFKEMITYFETNNLKPIIDKIFPLEEVNEAHTYMESGNQFGKIVLSIP